MISGAPFSVVMVAGAVAGVTWVIAGQINSATIDGKNATIESLKTQIESYKAKLNGATPEEAKKRIDELESISSAQQAQIIVLEQRLAPRDLSSEDRQYLINELKKWAIIPDSSAKRNAYFMLYFHATRESQVFQDELADTFKAAGWDVSKSPLLSPPEAFSGIRVRAASPIGAQDAAKFLSIALKSYGPTELLSDDVSTGCLRPEYKIDGACRGVQITVGEHP